MLAGATGPLEEKAVDEARRLALSAVQGSRGAFLGEIDAPALLAAKVGERAWRGLTAKQRARLEDAVRERFAEMLAATAASSVAIAWAQPLAAPPNVADVAVGISIADKTLKTRWRMKRDGSRWRIEDVLLSDPGISIAAAAIATLGDEPVRPKEGFPAAASALLPWLGLLAVIGLAVRVAAPRLSRERRRVLYGASLVPAAVLLAGASMAVLRLASERYSVDVRPTAEPWRGLERRAVAAESEGRTPQARELARRAAALGAPDGALNYEMGLAARKRGDNEAARRNFSAALEARTPAPGAARELAEMALERGDLAAAEQRIGFYLATTGPDPDALALQAVIEANLGKQSDAVRAIAAARSLLPPGPKAAELEAKIRARASDSAGAVAALRPLVESGTLNRETLRSDPAYLPIATEPAWVKFLNEK